MREKVWLLVNNLFFLGIAEYAETRCGIIISSRTFIALDNHKRASEVIFYCLFRQLDSEACRERLSPLFPCTDGRKAKDFRNALFKWLTELKRTSSILSTSVVRRSLLDDCAGERYEDLLFSLSSYLYLKHVRTKTDRRYKYQASLKALQNADAGLDELIVHDLIQTYKLHKLRCQRTHFKQLYNDFASTLRHDEQNMVDNKQTEVEDETNPLEVVERHLARLSKVVPNAICLALFRPVVVQVKPFYQNLPWKAQETKKQEAQENTPLRDLANEKQDSRRRVDLLELKTSQLPTAIKSSQDMQPKTISDAESDPAVELQVSRVVFKRKRYNDFRKDLEARLETLEPGYQITAMDDAMMQSIRQLSPTKPVASQLPRRVKPREIKSVKDTLQRTLLKSRIKPIQLPELNDEDDTFMPSTPQRPTSNEHVSSTIKTINRLINVLNDSDESISVSRTNRQYMTPSKNANRRLESSFNLWATHDD